MGLIEGLALGGCGSLALDALVGSGIGLSNPSHGVVGLLVGGELVGFVAIRLGNLEIRATTGVSVVLSGDRFVRDAGETLHESAPVSFVARLELGTRVFIP